MYEATAEVEEKNQKYNLGLEGKELRDEIRKVFKKKVTEHTQILVDSLNTMGCSDSVVDAMLTGIRLSHRHLQGEFWHGIIKLMKAQGNLDPVRDFDGRNEWTKEACERMYIAGMYPESIDLEKYSIALQ